MTTHAINSGAINAVPFPGAEEGESIVDMSVDVTAVAALSTIKLRLCATAITSGAATVANISARKIINFGASGSCVAAVSCGGITKARVLVQASSGVASTSARALLQSRVSAASSGIASALPVGTQCRIVRSASTSGIAATSVGSSKSAYRSAVTAAAAVATVNALRKARVGATTAGLASSSAGVAIKLAAPATTQASALGSAASQSLVKLGGSTQAIAQESTPILGLLVQVIPFIQSASAVALNANGTITSRLSAIFDGGCQASATGRLDYRFSAQTVATVSYIIAAADYAAAERAPEDRQMIVTAQDRYMKVLT